MSNKDKKNKTSVKPGEKLAEKYNEERSVEIFNELIEYAIANDCYSIQEVLIRKRDLIKYSTFYSLMKRFPNLKPLKKELDAAIISRCNRGAILKDLSSPAAIWRMKQLGETDKTEQTVITKDYDVVL